MTRSVQKILLVACIFAIFALSGCGCNLHPPVGCWFGKCEPSKGLPTTTEAITDLLKDEVESPLSRFDKMSGFVTTPVGKNLGIIGWSDLHRSVNVTGIVEHAAYSADKFYTVDILIQSIEVDGSKLKLSGKHYIRAEICMACISLAKEKWPQAGEKVSVKGKLKWDADGFLEVHPQTTSDIKVFKKKQGNTL